MKKYVVLLGMVALAVTLANCGQKSKDEASLIQEIAYENEAMNNVATDNAAVMDGTLSEAVATDSLSDQLASSSAVVTSNPTSRDIQQALKNAGLYAGKIDGSLGPKSKEAIREFQTQNGLKADGKVGPMTWGKLGPYLNQAASIPTDSGAISAQTLGE